MFSFHYFERAKLSQGFVALYSGRMLQYVGFSLVGLFIPVYLLIAFNYKIEYVLYFYLAGNILYGFILPLGAQFMNKIGLRRSLRISVFLFAMYYVFLNFLSANTFLFSALAIFFVVSARTFFWMPFNTDMAKFTNSSNRGKGIGLMWATRSFLSVILPIASGFLIKYFDFNVVFLIAIIIYLCSLIPFMSLPRTEERYDWGYFETFKKFFSKENRQLVLANMANGAENTVGVVVWPIFIWQLLDGDFVSVGVLSSLIVLITIVLQLVVGNYTDKLNKRKMIHWGSLLYASGWLVKVFVLTSFHIFIAGAYHSFTKIFKDTPFDALNYEMISNHGHFIDEYTVLREMAVQFGKVLMILFILTLLTTFGLNWVFLLGALASLMINFL
jgi:MFS family permease